MYCVVQKIQNKRCNQYGTSKGLEAYEWGLGDVVKYSYGYIDEHFERPIKDAYKVTLRQSYRENGKVKQHQWTVCTVDYYSLIEYGLYDYADRKIKAISEETGISYDELWELITSKLNPIENKIQAEFDISEEGQAKAEQRRTLDAYRDAKQIFESKYGKDSYDFCYDVFGVLRNEAYLKQLKSSYQKQKHTNYKSSYQEYNWNNYSSSSNGQGTSMSEEERTRLRKIYKKLSIKLHPDNGGSEEAMQMLNQFKEALGL